MLAYNKAKKKNEGRGRRHKSAKEVLHFVFARKISHSDRRAGHGAEHSLVECPAQPTSLWCV